MEDSPQIAHVELHDARVDDILLSADGRGVLRLKHVTVYRQVAEEHFELWSYRARIHFEGLDKFELNGTLSDDDYVSDGRLTDAEGSELELVAFLDGGAVAQVHLDFGSGAGLRLALGGLRVELTEAVRRMEEWIGPL